MPFLPLWLSVVYGLRLSDLNKETTLLYFFCLGMLRGLTCELDVGCK